MAAVGTAAALASLSSSLPAYAAAAPGQSVVNDYGQTPAEVTAEVTAAVAANANVVKAKALYVARHATVLARAKTEATLRTAYVAALRTRNAARIARARRAYVTAHAVTVAAKAVETKARLAYLSTVARTTAAVRALHYLPVDGTYPGTAISYLVPTVPFSFEPMQVQITVYAGHVSNVVVMKQAAPTSDSASYNNKSLSTLTLEAMTAGDTANVANVSGASLSSEAFQQSLQSALIKAGFKA